MIQSRARPPRNRLAAIPGKVPDQPPSLSSTWACQRDGQWPWTGYREERATKVAGVLYEEKAADLEERAVPAPLTFVRAVTGALALGWSGTRPRTAT